MSQKYCAKCDTQKPLEEFGKNRAKKDGLATSCKECRNGYAKGWYAENTEAHIAAVQVSKSARKMKAQTAVIEHLIKHPCVDCGETDIEVLDFDHREPAEKEHGVAKLVADGAALDKIAAEIAKCDVRCANCHRRRTGRQFGWYKVRMSG